MEERERDVSQAHWVNKVNKKDVIERGEGGREGGGHRGTASEDDRDIWELL